MNHWSKKVVVVTGGSQGLGREIGLSFARRGATVIALGRSPESLDRLVAESAENQWKIVGLPADVTDDESVRDAVKTIVEDYGQIDVWVNNVGKSTRAAVSETPVERYRELMEINFYSAVRCSLEVLKTLEASNGHLVNIGSLASKTGYPWMGPYSASKHALAAFHHQLRLEGPRNIHYLHVCPGPIQRDDSATRYSGESAGLGDSASRPGGGVKLKGIQARKLADRIERACRKRKPELVLPGYTRILFALAQFAPRWTDWLLQRSRKG